MAIELSNQNYDVTKKRSGQDAFDMTAGKSLKIETSPAGEELLNVEVPVGKKWSVSIGVQISESDA